MNIFKRLSLAYGVLVGREEKRCPSCAAWVSCPAYMTGVAYPCPYYEPIKRPPDWPGWKYVKKCLGRDNV